MCKKISIVCMISILLLSFSSLVMAKQLFMILHYDNGKISVSQNICKSEIGKKMSMLQIKSGEARVEEQAFTALNNRNYKCQILGKN